MTVYLWASKVYEGGGFAHSTVSPGPRAEPSTGWALSEHLAYVSEPSSVSTRACMSVTLSYNHGCRREGMSFQTLVGLPTCGCVPLLSPMRVYMNQRQRDHSPLLAGHAGSGRVCSTSQSPQNSARAIRAPDGSCLSDQAQFSLGEPSPALASS